MKNLLALVAPLVLVISAGCSEGSQQAAGPQVLTALYPLQFVAQRVAGADADVVNLTAPGAEPHDLELTAKQVAALSQADVAVYIRGLQPAVDDALAQSKPKHVINLLDHLKTLPATEDEHQHGHVDPHVWLDPKNLKRGTAQIARALGESDPAHAAAYRKRAKKLMADLDVLDHEYMTGLRTCERRTIVTSHAAFAYLARAYHLQQIPIAGLDPAQEPNTSDLARISSEVERQHVTTVFTERLVSPAVAKTVARETGATTAVLDPIEGLTAATSHLDYLSLMRANLAAIRKADGCS